MMGKFKGTQGKWFPSHMSINYTAYHDNMTKIWHPMGSREQKANALLISKATEMLEKLEECLIILGDVPLGSDMSEWVKSTKQLIKEATEL